MNDKIVSKIRLSEARFQKLIDASPFRLLAEQIASIQGKTEFGSAKLRETTKKKIQGMMEKVGLIPGAIIEHLDGGDGRLHHASITQVNVSLGYVHVAKASGFGKGGMPVRVSAITRIVKGVETSQVGVVTLIATKEALSEGEETYAKDGELVRRASTDECMVGAHSGKMATHVKVVRLDKTMEEVTADFDKGFQKAWGSLYTTVERRLYVASEIKAMMTIARRYPVGTILSYKGGGLMITKKIGA